MSAAAVGVMIVIVIRYRRVVWPIIMLIAVIGYLHGVNN